MSYSIPALFFAGTLTFLSPCVLPLVPIYLAMLAGTSAAALRDGSRGKGLVASTIAFSLGLASVFVILGLAASAVGRALSGHRALVLQLAGLAIFLAGLKLMGFLRVPWLDREARPWLASIRRSGGLLWPFLFGAAFALGWSPCVGPILGSVLAYAGSAGSPGKAAVYLAIYALGLTLPLVLVSLVAPAALRLLDKAKRHLRLFELASGTLLAAMGLLLITGHESVIMAPSGAQPPWASVAATIPTSSPNSPAPVTCNADLPPKPQTPEASTSLRTEGRPTLLEFVAESCPICQRMHPIVTEAGRSCARHGVHVQQIDVSTRSGRELAAQKGVFGVPTFLFLDGAGKEVARLVGEQPLSVLIQSIEVLAGEKCDGFRPLPLLPAAGS